MNMLFIDSKGKVKYRKKKKVDFVFIYEIKNREIQGISLIGYELMRRGYTVGYINTWHATHHADIRYAARVAVVFGAYNTEVIEFALSFIESCNNVLNMQWEELLNDACLDKDSFFMLRGKASDVYHVSWGKTNKDHLVNTCNIPSEHVRITGHVGTDFLRRDFRGFHQSKEEIFHEYGLKSDYKLLLFISTFAPPNLLEKEFAEASVESQNMIIQWLVRYAKEHPDTYIIYRPHPTEVLNSQIKKSIIQCDNIKVIKDYSIQQWIVIADTILNWWSTSLCDIYAAGKTCVFVRPCKIPDRDEYHLFRKIEMASTYDEMIKMIELDEPVISKDDMQMYYLFDSDELVYKKIVAFLEEIYRYKSGLNYYNNNKRKFKERGIILEAREIYGYIKYRLYDLLMGKNTSAETIYHRQMMTEYYISEREIIHLINKIKKFI